jgi:hypothetical protein
MDESQWTCDDFDLGSGESGHCTTNTTDGLTYAFVDFAPSGGGYDWTATDGVGRAIAQGSGA